MIEAKRAGLVLESVAVLHSDMEYMGTTAGGMAKMAIDIEAKFLKHDKDENRNMIKISSVVTSRTGQGYHIEIEMVCQFNCENSDEANDSYTMLCISVGNLREAIMQLTLHGVHGIYTMPLIDTYNLYNKIVKKWKDIEPLPEKEIEK